MSFDRRRALTRSLSRRRAADDADMDITPMIDITFLLLIFFLVASRLDVSLSVELPPAVNAQAIAAKGAVILTLGLDEGGGALVYLGDGRDPEFLLQEADPERREQRITQYVREGLEGRLPAPPVILKADRRAPSREVSTVSQAAAAAGDVRVLHVAVEELRR